MKMDDRTWERYYKPSIKKVGIPGAGYQVNVGTKVVGYVRKVREGIWEGNLSGKEVEFLSTTRKEVAERIWEAAGYTEGY